MVEALARAAATPYAEIAAVSVMGQGGAPAPLLWRAYSGLDRRLFGGRNDWSAPVDVAALADAERRLVRGDPAAWRARLRDARLDVAFVLGEVAEADVEGLARFGTWRFCFGEAQCTDAALAGVREVLDARPVLASGIRIHRGAGRPDRVACQSWARTFPFSLAKSREVIFAKTADFVARALRDLHLAGPRWLDEATEVAAAPVGERLPGGAAALRDIATLGARVAARAAEKALTVDEWSIAFRFADDPGWDGSLDGFHRLQPPRGWYWADPFPIQVGGRSFIFFEELPAGAARAHISVVEVDRDGRASPPRKVLERDYHLSYPFLVEEGGRLYMIPETAHNNTVEIYRCTEFPLRWELERVLMKGVFCADATLHREADRWWMFANVARPGEDINDELCLFSATELLGDWKPHRRNPVKSDVRSARPAGRLFRRGGRLYRPGQIGAPLYGSGIALNRVERLTPDEYVEREETRILPRPAGGVLGLHTINRAGDLSVTDAFVRRPRF